MGVKSMDNTTLIDLVGNPTVYRVLCETPNNIDIFDVKCVMLTHIYM